MRKLVLMLAIVVLAGCTDWKSKYWQAQLELERLKQTQPTTVVITDTVTVPQYPAVWDTLPIVVPENPPSIKVDEPRKTSSPQVLRTRREVVQKDSVTVWLRIDTRLSGDEVYTRVVVDSVRYPKIIRTVYRNIPPTRPPASKHYPWGLVVTGIMGLLALYLILRIIKMVIT